MMYPKADNVIGGRHWLSILYANILFPIIVSRNTLI